METRIEEKPFTMTTKQQRVWYVDGVSCLGKTTFVAAQHGHGLKLDYAERTQRTPFFRRKADSHIVQILYTATFGLELLQHKNDDDGCLFVDRSPISDIWYELLFKHFGDRTYYDQVFDMIEQLDVFDSMPTVFVVPHERHGPAICEQMRKRDNKLDHISTEYVLQQIAVFRAVIERFGRHRNVRVIEIGPDVEIFSNDYFAWIAAEFHRMITL